MTSWSIRTSPAVLVPSLARMGLFSDSWLRQPEIFKLLRRGLDRGDHKGVQRAVLVADRDILAGSENVVAEAVSGLVVILGFLVVIEHPACMLGPPRLVKN